jgi:hypothetical protein
MEVHIKAVQVDFKLQVKTQKAANGNVVPAVSILSHKVFIPPHGLKFKFHGGILAHIANLIKNIFIGTIRHELNVHLGSAIGNNLPGPVNNILAKSKGDTEVFKGIDLDWGLGEQPRITKERVGFGVHG